MDHAVESALRVTIMDWVRERAEANGGFLHRHELLSYRVGDRDLPIINFSRGIRTPGVPFVDGVRGSPRRLCEVAARL